MLVWRVSHFHRPRAGDVGKERDVCYGQGPAEVLTARIGIAMLKVADDIAGVDNDRVTVNQGRNLNPPVDGLQLRMVGSEEPVLDWNSSPLNSRTIRTLRAKGLNALSKSCMFSPQSIGQPIVCRRMVA